ncbi:MAG TPA: N-acetyl-gamma-glutamyl-phosphate reductase, partial [Polyangiaceae bacterium]
MAKRFKAAVIGGSGYGGAELVRRLILHPDVELARVASIDFIGEPLSAVHPNLDGVTDLKFEGITPAEAAQGMDVVLLGLPHKVSAHKMPELIASGAKVVDLSGDFRLRDAAVYKKYYGAEHPNPSSLSDGTFVYGLPELNREAIKKAKYVASPGCFATTIELALLPLAKAGLLEGDVEVVGITGSSGSGIAPSAGTHHPVRAVNLRTYKPLDHQHIPEIEMLLNDAGAKNVAIRFVPVSAPLSRGIFATSFVRVAGGKSADEIRALYKDF